jgi:glycosyltransferase involved in cell wall biosynthesis
MSAASMTEPARIVLIDPSNFTTPYDLALAGALEGQGQHVRLVGQVGGLPDRHSHHEGHFYPVLASRLGRRLSPAGARWVKGACHGIDMLRLLRRLTMIDATILHFQWSPLPTIDRWTIPLLQRRRPVVLTLHDSNPYQGGASWLMRQGYASLLQIFNAIIVHTQQASHRVADIGINPDRIYQIPHGLLGEPGNRRPLAAPRLDRDRLVLLQFGKIKPYKGVDLLLQALTLVPEGLRGRLDVRIVGKPYIDTAPLEHFVDANGLTGCVTFRFEFVSEAEEERLFAEADAVLLPYREIDASGVAMSAIARCRPVLATATEGFYELFGENGGARLVPVGDTKELAKVIVGWISDPRQVRALAEAMQIKRTNIPSWTEIAGSHIAVYAEARARWLVNNGPCTNPLDPARP